MSNPVIYRSHGHPQPAYRSKGPGGILFPVGIFGYLCWRAIELRGIGKRYDERQKEVMRRERLIEEGYKEVSRLISEAETKRRG